MTQRNQLITGITFFLVLLVGSAWVNSQLLLDEPPSKITSMATGPHTDKHATPAPAVSSWPGAMTTTASSTTMSDPDTVSTPPAETPAADPDSSLAYASPVPVAQPAPLPASATSPDITSAPNSEGQAVTKDVVTLADLQFGFSRSGLGDQSKVTLDAYAEALDDPQWSVLIQGHTDETGSIRNNLRVGLRRANVVKQYLMAQGIPGSRLHVVSLGEYQPVCTEQTPACLVQNRRVSFSVAQRESIPTPPVLPVTHQQASPIEPTVLAVEQVDLSDILAEPLTKADLPDVHADLRAYDARIRMADRFIPAKMELVYPEPVHGTLPSTMTPTVTITEGD